jgi:hypothetical protein
MSMLPKDSDKPEAADAFVQPQTDAPQVAIVQEEDPGSFTLEDFDLDDIEVIESKVFA